MGTKRLFKLLTIAFYVFLALNTVFILGVIYMFIHADYYSEMAFFIAVLLIVLFLQLMGSLSAHSKLFFPLYTRIY